MRTLLAQGNIIPDNPGLPSNGINGQPLTLYGSVFGIIQLLLGLIGLIAVGFIVYGGFKYITARGDEKATEEAKKTILNAIIGLVVVLLSYVIVTIISNTIFSGRIN